jgi:hydrogenase maturation protease
MSAPHAASTPRPPLLVLGWGNPGRGDDALGPLFVERLQVIVGDHPRVAWLSEMQLQPEHALDLAGRAHVLLVDVSTEATPPFALSTVEARRDVSLTSHAMSPQALLETCRRLPCEPPPTTLLAVHGEQFGLGDPLSPAAERHLADALAWGEWWVLAHAPVAPPPDRVVYHICPRADLARAQAAGAYRADSLAREGFIHLSRAHQVRGTAQAYFAGVRDLVLLVIDPARLSVPLVYEAPAPLPTATPKPAGNRTEVYPHVYGPIDLGAIVAVIDLEACRSASAAG